MTVENMEGLQNNIAFNDVDVIQIRRSQGLAIVGVAATALGTTATVSFVWLGGGIGLLAAVPTVSLGYLSMFGRRYDIDKKWSIVQQK